MSAINPGWNFDNSYARLPKKLFSPVNPTPVSAPELVVLNHPLAKRLGLNPEVLQSGDGLAVLAGNSVPDGAHPIAQAYAGHQFGYFTMLGDGRAILLGEQITPQGERCDIQLKGPGLTPYSRGGDGRAALGPMLREYIISEAMHALGIATTRGLAVVTTGETIMRDTVLPGAILTRVAASHIRVGTFQYASQWGGVEELQALADYTIRRHYPEVYNDDNRYLTLLHEVVKRQAALIATWQLVGFVHGVMNTDNMAISGETIDYGPCAFMDAYDPATVFSSIDRGGRYAYGKQPDMAAWNLARFAEALLPLIHDDSDQAVKLAQDEISRFGERFRCNWLGGIRAKLGLSNEEPEDEQLIERLLSLMHEHQADYTNTFRALTFARLDGSSLFTTPEFQQWQVEWKARLGRQPQSEAVVLQLMRQSNPALIPRNHRVEEALEAAEHGDYGVMERLLRALANPFAHSTEQEDYAMPSGRPYKTFCGT